MTADKRAVRQAARRARDALLPELRAALSARIVGHLQTWLAERFDWQHIGLFVPFGSEVDITALRGLCTASGRQVFAPRVAGDAAALRFVRLDAQTVWRRAPAGFNEPQADGLPAGALDVVLVPGLLFDGRGYRLGYGGGYYDKALFNTSVYTIGVGFASQRVERLPTEPHDVALRALVDETGVWLCTG